MYVCVFIYTGVMKCGSLDVNSKSKILCLNLLNSYWNRYDRQSFSNGNQSNIYRYLWNSQTMPSVYSVIKMNILRGAIQHCLTFLGPEIK